MEYRTPFPWYIDPPIHGISNPPNTDSLTPTNPWYLEPLPMVKWSPYPWNIEPLIHGISNPIPMVFSPPTHGTSNTLQMVYWTPSFGIMDSIYGSKYYDRNLAQWSKYHMVYWPPGWFFRGSKYHMTPVFSVVCVARYLILFLFFGRLLYPFVIFFFWP